LLSYACSILLVIVRMCSDPFQCIPDWPVSEVWAIFHPMLQSACLNTLSTQHAMENLSLRTVKSIFLQVGSKLGFKSPIPHSPASVHPQRSTVHRRRASGQGKPFGTKRNAPRSGTRSLRNFLGLPSPFQGKTQHSSRCGPSVKFVNVQMCLGH